MKRILSVALMFAASIAAQLPTKLADLGGALGYDTVGPAALIGGNLYFTCQYGGNYGGGTLVTYVPGVGSFKLIDFNYSTSGALPRGVTASGTTLYVSLSQGGPTGGGTICSYSLQSGLLVVLHGRGSPYPVAIDGATLWFGDPNLGIRSIDLASGVVATVNNFGFGRPFAGAGHLGVVSGNTLQLSPVSMLVPTSTGLGGSTTGFGIESGLFRWSRSSSIGGNEICEIDFATGAQTTVSVGATMPSLGGFGLGDCPWVPANQSFVFSSGSGLGLFHVNAKSILSGSTSAYYGDQVSFIRRDSAGMYVLMRQGGASGSGTLLWYPDPILATASTVGVSCGSTTLQLGYGNPPRLGESFPLTISGAPAFSQGTYFFSAPTSVVTPVSGCGVYLDVATISTLGTLFTTPFGAHSLPIPLPTNPAIAGAPARIQALVLPPNGGFQLSNGLDITLGF